VKTFTEPKAFTEPLKELQGYEELEQALKKTTGVIQVSGCIDAIKPHIAYSVNNGSGNRIIVTFHEQKAKELLEEYRFFDKKAAYYPAKDILFYQSDIRGNVLTAERINALKMMAEEKECTIITTFDGLMNPMPSPEKFIQAVKKISVGDIVELNELTKHLVELGYEKNYQAETMGEFSVRGGIIDIFPLTEENPFRIELWGDEVDSIRSFDPESQRSIENLQEVYIYPACELVLTEEERRSGVEKIKKEAKKVADKFRKEMKTEEACHRKQRRAAES
jgi:transcription-repair coupling factor (superfamily II helicase)